MTEQATTLPKTNPALATQRGFRFSLRMGLFGVALICVALGIYTQWYLRLKERHAHWEALQGGPFRIVQCSYDITTERSFLTLEGWLFGKTVPTQVNQLWIENFHVMPRECWEYSVEHLFFLPQVNHLNFVAYRIPLEPSDYRWLQQQHGLLSIDMNGPHSNAWIRELPLQPDLREVAIQNTNLTPDDLAQLLAKTPALRRLVIPLELISPASTKMLAKCQYLDQLDISETYLCEDYQAKINLISQSLPNCDLLFADPAVNSMVLSELHARHLRLKQFLDLKLTDVEAGLLTIDCLTAEIENVGQHLDIDANRIAILNSPRLLSLRVTSAEELALDDSPHLEYLEVRKSSRKPDIKAKLSLNNVPKLRYLRIAELDTTTAQALGKLSQLEMLVVANTTEERELSVHFQGLFQLRTLAFSFDNPRLLFSILPVWLTNLPAVETVYLSEACRKSPEYAFFQKRYPEIQFAELEHTSLPKFEFP